jgi:hypothetical protein
MATLSTFPILDARSRITHVQDEFSDSERKSPLLQLGNAEGEGKTMLIMNHSEVPELLPMRKCMDVVGETLANLARG